MVIVGEEDTPAIETDVMPVDLTPVEPQIKRQNDTDSGGKLAVRRDKPTRFGVGYEYRMRRNGSAVRPDHPGRVQRQLMSPEERADFRDSMQSAQTVEERKRIRTEQHALMQERAKAQGILCLIHRLCVVWVASDSIVVRILPCVVWEVARAAKRSRSRSRVNLPAIFRVISLWVFALKLESFYAKLIENNNKPG